MTRGGGQITGCRGPNTATLDRTHSPVYNGFFTGRRAQAISTERVLAYVRHRQQQQAVTATIKRELATLKRMFRLGERAGRVVRRLFIDLLQERNARTGFFERAECDAVLAQLPATPSRSGRPPADPRGPEEPTGPVRRGLTAEGRWLTAEHDLSAVGSSSGSAPAS
jgi:hypothetical protein